MTWTFQPSDFDSPNPNDGLTDVPVEPHDAYSDLNELIDDLWNPLPNWEWPPSNINRAIIFKGTSSHQRYKVVSPDPDVSWANWSPGGDTTNPIQTLANIYLPAGFSVVSIGSSYTDHALTALGIARYFGTTSYLFYLKDLEGDLSPIDELNQYSTPLKIRGYQLQPSKWQFKNGFQYDFSYYTKDILSVTEEPIENYQYNAPSPPPNLPSPPPPAPPPCDIQIGLDSGEGYFCMANSEYTEFTQNNQRANERLTTIINNLQRFP